MTENKTDNNIEEPRCIRCSEIIRHPSGEPVSEEAYEGLDGICNTCMYEIRVFVEEKKEVAQNEES